MPDHHYADGFPGAQRGVFIMTNDIKFEDPIDEVYAVRRKISSRYGHNIRKIVEAAREWMRQDEDEGRVYVSFPSARIAPAMA